MKEVANEMGSSHQNIKQIAIKLEQKGLLILEKDKRDARMTRLKLTENGYGFWQKIKKEGTEFTRTVFKDIDKYELVVARRVMQKIILNINEIDTKNERLDKCE